MRNLPGSDTSVLFKYHREGPCASADERLPAPQCRPVTLALDERYVPHLSHEHATTRCSLQPLAEVCYQDTAR
ncbi:hypothetical protein AOQ84DRAFT_354252 [Glonium stellatum]|uniref:Uncharacterized protein n=1 Tax=Glonium stellatum TaxID=574774 RepID=A0A8E2F283_9PEZI|nr:hypothetical protein AOQ84DRAFT_354252 [Glonium stellatum]